MIDPDRRALFLHNLTRTGLLMRSALRAGLNPSTLSIARKTDPEFEAEVTEALERHAELIDAEIDRRGRLGVDKPVFHQGVKCGSVKQYSDALLLARAKARMPDAYRERAGIDVSVGAGGVLVVGAPAPSEAEWKEKPPDEIAAPAGEA